MEILFCIISVILISCLLIIIYCLRKMIKGFRNIVEIVKVIDLVKEAIKVASENEEKENVKTE